MVLVTNCAGDRTTVETLTGPAGTPPALSWRAGHLLRDGEPTALHTGSMHYFRVHPGYWRDRMRRLVDLGVNTVDTYVAWNFHQPREDTAPDFTGWADLGAFLETAAEVGLDAVVRPGPYICGEWSNGGLPVWLTARGMPLRTADPRFLDPVARWFDVLVPRLAEYQAGRGGPVVAVQVENEFGSFGDDAAYLTWLAQALTSRGVTELLFTADGPTEVMLDGGSIPGILAAVTLGSAPEQARRMLRERRPGEPFVCAEYWNGWFDHWGGAHHVRDAGSAAATLRGIVADGGSVSIYMAHGGTNFGLWAGANDVGGAVRGTTTSYDSDAPIAEDGRLTAKFDAIREVLAPGAPAPVSRPPRFLPPRTVALRPGPGLDDVFRALAVVSVETSATGTFDEFGMDNGLVRYRAEVRLPSGPVELHFGRVADRGQVRMDGTPVGVVEDRGSLTLDGPGRTARIDVLVESLGRINYGPRLGEPKGLLAPVLVERRMIQGWRAERLDLCRFGIPELDVLAAAGAARPAGGPGVSIVDVDLDEALDTHLALPDSGHGVVWVNGFLLGRYRSSGPQRTLYVPAPLLHAGRNRIIVLELDSRGTVVELRDRPDLGPAEQYIEQF